ncbi:MAG: OmpA family protein [Gemmatimonadaceae bacterium]|nr:OmpA family protein [Gemmatimonadaceae bacterium]
MRRRLVVAGALGALALITAPAPAQGILGKIKDRARTEVDRKEDAAINAVVNSVSCAITDKACIKKAHDAGEPVKVTDKNGKAVSSADSAAAISAAVAQAASISADDSPAGGAAGGNPGIAPVSSTSASGGAPGAGAWLNYDFVPGSRTMFFEDFTGEDVGDFPARMKLKNGNVEVANVKGQKMLRAAETALVYIVFTEKLPDRFTIEMNMHTPTVAYPMDIYTSGGNQNRMGCYPNSAFVHAEATSESKAPGNNATGFFNCRFTVDTRYVRGYIDSTRTANAPGVSFVRTDTLFIQLPGGTKNDPTLVSSIRIAEGGKKLYDLISTKGRAATQGILFDEGSDHIRGESTPTLAEIADMLKTHGPLSLTIEGHTDNVGTAAANKTLSEKRAVAVKQYLVGKYGIASIRLKTAGFGATKPASPNTTPEGRQNNRRVELVKL